jgi:putative phage-type endonuclease
MSLTPGQRALRRESLGGSEIAAIFGLDKFKTPLDVYLAKVEGWEPARTDDMMRGDHLEDGVAQWYAEKHGVEVKNLGATLKHQAYEHVHATPDRLINTALGGTEDLSIKVPRRADEWGEDETQEYPERYNIQVQVEAAVLGSHGYVLAGGWIAAPVWGDLRRYPVRLDEELQNTLCTAADRWWAKHVTPRNCGRCPNCVFPAFVDAAGTVPHLQAGQPNGTLNTHPPDLDAGEGAREWLLRKFPGEKRKAQVVREASLTETALVMQLKEAEAAKEAAEEQYETIRRNVEACIGNDDALRGSFGKVSWLVNQWGKRTLRKTWARSS